MTLVTWLKDRKKENTIVPKTFTKAVYDDAGNTLDQIIEGKYINDIVGDAYDNTKTYTISDYCIKDNILYKCNTKITKAEEFDFTKWTATTCGKELNTLNNVKANKSWTLVGEGTSVDITTVYNSAYEYYVIFTNVSNISTDFRIPYNVLGRTFVNGYYFDDKFSASHGLYCDKTKISIYEGWTNIIDNGVASKTAAIKVYYR